MEDLLQSQIRESCKLALPNGLKDLMADISREVLRAQPANLYQFITDYLSVMLVARENLNIAAKVCDDVCKSHCCPELEDELREVGLSDEDVEEAIKIITNFFESDEVNEGNLLMKLLKNTEMEETQLPAVLAAVRHAFLKHQLNNTAQYESSSSDSDMDETLAAAKHTLKLYRKVKEPDENYNAVVVKIQAAYRAYNLRRNKLDTCKQERPLSCKKTDVPEKSLRFETKMEELYPPNLHTKRCASKASSISLAGSFITLPPYKPYSINDCSDIVEQDEIAEMENTNIDYTTDPQSNWNDFPGYSGAGNIKKDSMNKKTISFHELPQIIGAGSVEAIDDAAEADYYHEDYDSEEINEDEEVGASEIDEDVEVKEIGEDDEVTEIDEDDEVKEISEDDEVKEIEEDEVKDIDEDDKIQEIGGDDGVKEIGENDEVQEIGDDDGVIEIVDDDGVVELGEDDDVQEIGEDDEVQEIGDDDEVKEINEDEFKERDEDVYKEIGDDESKEIDKEFKDIGEDNNIKEISEHDDVKEIDENNDFKELGEHDEFEEFHEDVIQVQDMNPVDLIEPVAKHRAGDNIHVDDGNDVGDSFSDDSQSS